MAEDTALTTVTLRLSAQLRDIAGAKAVELPVPADGTVRDLLRALRVQQPALADRTLNPDDTLRTGIQLIMGGRHIDFLQGLDTPLAGQTDLLLIPPLAGG